MVLRLVAGTALWVAGSWFGVCGSWSRMRHQRAAAGWSSGRGPAAAADRTRWVASKPARVRLVNLSSSSGRNGSAVALGASRGEQLPPLQVCMGIRGGESLVESLLEDRAALSSWGGPVGRRSPGSTWVAARHSCTSAINSAGTRARRTAAQAGASPSALLRTWSAS